MNKRIISINVDDILSLISCAETYGFSNSVLLGTFRDWLDDKLSEKEIQNYAKDVASTEGYSEEDGDNAAETLKEFKNRFKLK